MEHVKKPLKSITQSAELEANVWRKGTVWILWFQATNIVAAKQIVKQAISG